MQKALPYIVAGLLAVVIVEAIILFNRSPVTNDKELIDIDRHEKEVKALNVTIDALDSKIRVLQQGYDSLEQVKTKTHEVFISEVRDIELLPFPVKSDIFTTEAARVDSIRARYLGWN